MNSPQHNLQIAEDAADWLLRLETERSEDCRREFIAWLRHSPRHMEEFLMMSAVTRIAKQGGRGQGIDVDALIREASTTVVPLARRETRAEKTSPVRRMTGRRWTAALAVAAALGALAIGVNLGMEAGTYSTPIGEQRSVKLEDGSLIYLNTGSRVKVDYSSRHRDIRLLQGEALFVAARDTARPFRVLVDAAVVQALGTQFNVYRRGDTTTVSVVEGRVMVTHRNAPAARPGNVLIAGQQTRVAGDGRVLEQKRTANLDTATAWRQRRLVFQNESLANIAHEFNRYNRAQIRITDDTAAARRFTAVFNADEPMALIRFLHDDAALKIDQSAGDEIIIEDGASR